MELGVCHCAAHQRFHFIVSTAPNVNRVLEPFAGFKAVDHVSIRVRADDVDVLGGSIEAALIARSVVVVRNCFTAGIEVFGLEAAGDC